MEFRAERVGVMVSVGVTEGVGVVVGSGVDEDVGVTVSEGTTTMRVWLG